MNVAEQIRFCSAPSSGEKFAFRFISQICMRLNPLIVFEHFFELNRNQRLRAQPSATSFRRKIPGELLLLSSLVLRSTKP